MWLKYGLFETYVIESCLQTGANMFRFPQIYTDLHIKYFVFRYFIITLTLVTTLYISFGVCGYMVSAMHPNN